MADRIPIPTTPVKSSNVKAHGYAGGVLQIDFKNGKSYQYDGVPPEAFRDLQDADADPEKSYGSTFHGGVRKTHKGIPLEAVKK